MQMAQRARMQRTADEEFVVGQERRSRPRFLTDRSGRLFDANIDACLMVDHGRGFLMGKQLSLLIDRADVPRMNEVLRSMEPGQGRTVRLRMRSRTGVLRAVQIQASLQTTPDRVVWTARPQFLDHDLNLEPASSSNPRALAQTTVQVARYIASALARG